MPPCGVRKTLRAFAILAFFDRCGNCAQPSSATGSGGGAIPSSARSVPLRIPPGAYVGAHHDAPAKRLPLEGKLSAKLTDEVFRAAARMPPAASFLCSCKEKRKRNTPGARWPRDPGGFKLRSLALAGFGPRCRAEGRLAGSAALAFARKPWRLAKSAEAAESPFCRRRKCRQAGRRGVGPYRAAAKPATPCRGRPPGRPAKTPRALREAPLRSRNHPPAYNRRQYLSAAI